ncbi:flagellar protein FlaG [uncultured Tyzzerella sp.]|uniref:flagellar protein FlaG n=1 Tax=uncultured Tyzzerella sp. TaxID=2321398 RepID=UPI0029420B67|nr:flagellar protein FlaG [uncultured Tyzzerella sp.]
MEINTKFSNISNVDIEKPSLSNKEKIKSEYVVNNIHSNKEIEKNSPAIKEDSVSKETLDKLVTEVNNKYKLANKEFSYDIHEKTNRVTVKIKDSETGEVIKEIPSEKSLDLAAKIMEMAGLLIDEKS